MLTRHAGRGPAQRPAARVQGFASKSAEPGHIASVIAALHGGRRWIDQDVSAAAIVDDCPLTDREIDVLRVTRDGYSVAEIADPDAPRARHGAELPVQRHAEDPDPHPGTRRRATHASTTGSSEPVHLRASHRCEGAATAASLAKAA
jgi:hypothetical protein